MRGRPEETIMNEWGTWTLEPLAAPLVVRARRRVARTLRISGHLLAVAARRLRHDGKVCAQASPVFEFYAEAGAPEGALFVDGQRMGVLEGVTRL
jgi:hypothetical protein